MFVRLHSSPEVILSYTYNVVGEEGEERIGARVAQSPRSKGAITFQDLRSDDCGSIKGIRASTEVLAAARDDAPNAVQQHEAAAAAADAVQMNVANALSNDPAVVRYGELIATRIAARALTAAAAAAAAAAVCRLKIWDLEI